MPLIECRDVSFAYDATPVVEGLDFCVNRGDYLCIVGENGSGKSTLVKGLLGLKAPKGGQVTFGEGLRADHIGYLPQQTAPQKDFPASVWEVVLSGCMNAGGQKLFFTAQDKASATEKLELLGITALRKRSYRDLSGGQQQRVLLARALCATSALLLLDEPVSGLDPLVTAEFYSLVERLNREAGITVIMVSHDVHGILQYASHILHLNSHQAYFGPVAGYTGSEAGKSFTQKGGAGA